MTSTKLETEMVNLSKKAGHNRSQDHTKAQKGPGSQANGLAEKRRRTHLTGELYCWLAVTEKDWSNPALGGSRHLGAGTHRQQAIRVREERGAAAGEAGREWTARASSKTTRATDDKLSRFERRQAARGKTHSNLVGPTLRMGEHDWPLTAADTGCIQQTQQRADPNQRSVRQERRKEASRKRHFCRTGASGKRQGRAYSDEVLSGHGQPDACANGHPMSTSESGSGNTNRTSASRAAFGLVA